MANLGKNVDRCINSRRECTRCNGIQTLSKNRGSAEFTQSLLLLSLVF